MNDDRFMLWTSTLLGVLQMWCFFGFDMMSFLVEPICHSVRERCPECIIQFAGYYGTAVLCFSYTIGNLIAPCFLPLLGAKGCLILSSTLFSVYAANFFYLRTYFFFPANVCCGFAFALFYAGGGSYALRHSTDRFLSRNQSIQWMVASLTTLLSGTFLIFSASVLKEHPGNETEISAKGTENDAEYRQFSDKEIHLLSIGMSVLALASIILAFLLPKRELQGSLQKKVKNEVSLKKQICKVFWAMRQKSLLKVSFLFMSTGSFISLFLTIYPTTMSFTDSLARNKNLVAYYCIACCVGEFIVGFSITLLSKRIRDFGLIPAMSLTCVLYVIVAVLMILFTPAMASIGPTKDHAIFETNQWICILLGVLTGALDGSANNARMVAAAKGLPDEPAIAFSVSKFYQAAAQTICLSLGSILNLHQIICVIGVVLLISVFCYISYIRNLSERRVSSEEKLPQEFESTNY
ncbi:unnamed protein product, partial [Mesorhabditis belari]|uniref:Uncharacterized protein n=1 Tax=Mesorhabditis belari TaxID=2138241 RepID=A0AAF3EWM7_9BILA